MRYYRVKPQYDNYKLSRDYEKFDIVEISKNKTYWFFGARFAREVE